MKGKVDKDFWSHIAAHDGWGSGPRYIAGWVNVFMPFCEKGIYRLNGVKPESSEWGKVNQNDVPPSTVEVPVIIDDNGHEYETIFYGGHIVCLYNPDDDSIRPSLDWTIVDITGSTGPQTQRYGDGVPQRVQDNRPEAFEKPVKFSYGG